MPDFFADVRTRADVLEVARRRGVVWQRSGKNHVALCPFHAEKTPSFTAFEGDRPGYNCFGCGWNGSVIDLVQALEHYETDFAAAAAVAAECGVPVPARRERADPAAREAEQDALAALRRALEGAAEYYRRALRSDHPEAQRAREYLADRGLDRAAELFGLGYAPAGRALIDWLEARDVARDARIAAGISALGDDGAEYLRLRDRVTVEIRDETGGVIGFAGRVVG